MARNMLPSLIVNALCPLLIYLYLKRLYSGPSVIPISAAALFPVVGNVFSLLRNRVLDPFASAMLLGFGFTLAAIFISGNERIILIARSLLTFGMGLLALASLFLPKTISFYFARQFLTGNRPDEAAVFNHYWQKPYVRYASRLTSLVWGLALVGEFVFRVVIVYTQPIPRVLVLTPVVFNLVSMSTMVWTIWYANRAVRRINQDGSVMNSALQGAV
jgi:hypothetical protein